MTRIEFGEDYIAIYDQQGEIVRWLKQEWIENPDVVFPIANAVKLASEGIDLRQYLHVFAEETRKIVSH